MSVIVCGLPRGQSKAYRCPCCGYESNDLESFAVAMCWDCLYGNPECDTCISEGVPVHSFRSHRTKMHRYRERTAHDAEVITACGLHIAPDDTGQAIAVVTTYCQRCWPEKEV